jgi:uncharacterized membrane protein
MGFFAGSASSKLIEKSGPPWRATRRQASSRSRKITDKISESFYALGGMKEMYLIASPRVAAARAMPRSSVIVSWIGETTGSLDIAAPKEMLFTAYADIERMPQWSPLLESVTLVDSAKRCSEWALRVPRPLASLIRAAGMGQLVRWTAVHETEGCDVLRWQSLSGVKNSGEATFVYRGGGVTTVALRISYELPDLVGPVLSAPFAQRFVRRTLLSTMTRFKEALEAEAASQNRQKAGLGPL